MTLSNILQVRFDDLYKDVEQEYGKLRNKPQPDEVVDPNTYAERGREIGRLLAKGLRRFIGCFSNSNCWCTKN